MDGVYREWCTMSQSLANALRENYSMIGFEVDLDLCYWLVFWIEAVNEADAHQRA